jgi:hypothetical protein
MPEPSPTATGSVPRINRAVLVIVAIVVLLFVTYGFVWGGRRPCYGGAIQNRNGQWVNYDLGRPECQKD